MHTDIILFQTKGCQRLQLAAPFACPNTTKLLLGHLKMAGMLCPRCPSLRSCQRFCRLPFCHASEFLWRLSVKPRDGVKQHIHQSAGSLESGHSGLAGGCGKPPILQALFDGLMFKGGGEQLETQSLAAVLSSRSSCGTLSACIQRAKLSLADLISMICTEDTERKVTCLGVDAHCYIFQNNLKLGCHIGMPLT